MPGSESEPVDLVDRWGVVREIAVPRGEVRKYEGLHMQIVIAIVFDGLGRMLVQRRAQEPNVGSFDHICGAMLSGETPEEAAAREALEETGVSPSGLRVVTHGVNEYNRYRYLLVGQTNSETPIANPKEAQWAGYVHLDKLHALHKNDEDKFVDGFFTDIELARL